MRFPMIYRDGAETAPGAATPPEPAPVAPAAAPWAAEAEARFTDPAAREAFDSYMREVNQPYVSKVEAERAAAKAEAEALQGKTWVFDQLNDDPEAGLHAIMAQLYPDGDVADRVLELVKAGATPAAAEKQAVAEEGATELPAEVKETVEWAKTERDRQASDAAAKVEADALAAATAELNTWKDALVAKEADIKPDLLMRYVVSEDGDMEAAYAAYRVDFPAPAAGKAPVTIGGRAGGSSPTTPDFKGMSKDEVWAAIFEAGKDK